mmetsp:Transcript_124269/g.220209  ORF Transcript_124269/g.220209 Transcript_124269/m.220209 type:complete len:372 (-) Transcript_124269:20-1135(-)
MWAPYGGADFGCQWNQASAQQDVSGGAFAPWPPGALNGAMWWHEAAYTGWLSQAGGSMAAASATEQLEAMTQDLKPDHATACCTVTASIIQASAPQEQPPISKQIEPAGLSFSEMEKRLNRSWEDLVTKDQEFPRASNEDPVHRAKAEKNSSPAKLCVARSVSSEMGSDKAKPIMRSNANMFCPFCADRGSCPFHEKNHWPSARRNPETPQVLACEEPPASHIALAMADQVLDMIEDASTEDGSSDLSYGSHSDDWSDVGDVVVNVGAAVSSALLQEGLPAGSSWRQRPPEPRSERPTEAPQRESRARLQLRAPAPTTPPPPPPSQATTPPALRQLLAMGFPEVDARRALMQAGTRGIDAAVAILIDGAAA